MLTQSLETHTGRDLKQVQSTLKELTRRADAADVTGENLSAFVTGADLRDQVNLGVARVTKELEKYKAYMAPIESKVLGTSTSKSLQNQMDELNHELKMITDLQRTEVQDLNRVEAEVNTLKAWRAEMPSAIEISKRKV